MYYPVVFKTYGTRDIKKLRKKVINEYNKGFTICCAQLTGSTITAGFVGINAWQKDNLISPLRLEEVREVTVTKFNKKIEKYYRAGWQMVGLSKIVRNNWCLFIYIDT